MLQTAESRLEVVLPDIRPLPSLISRVDPSQEKRKTDEIIPRAAPLSDEEFRLRWEEGKLSSWGHEARLRVIWLTLQKHGRQQGVKRVFADLEAYEKEGHHVTVVYFWIQMIDYTMVKLKDQTCPTFGIFIQNPQSQQLRNPDLIDKYYSKKVLGMGKSEFQISDIKAMPSIL